MWIEINPVIEIKGKNIKDLIIFPRLEGMTLYPINHWPLSIYIYLALNENIYKIGKFAAEEVEMVAWGELYSTLEDARWLGIPKEDRGMRYHFSLARWQYFLRFYFFLFRAKLRKLIVGETKNR